MLSSFTFPALGEFECYLVSDMSALESVLYGVIYDNFALKQATWITQCALLLLDTRMPYGSLYVGCEEHLDLAGTGSFYNEGEADIVVRHVFNLIYSGILFLPWQYAILERWLGLPLSSMSSLTSFFTNNLGTCSGLCFVAYHFLCYLL